MTLFLLFVVFNWFGICLLAVDMCLFISGVIVCLLFCLIVLLFHTLVLCLVDYGACWFGYLFVWLVRVILVWFVCCAMLFGLNWDLLVLLLLDCVWCICVCLLFVWLNWRGCCWLWVLYCFVFLGLFTFNLFGFCCLFVLIIVGCWCSVTLFTDVLYVCYWLLVLGLGWLPVCVCCLIGV